MSISVTLQLSSLPLIISIDLRQTQVHIILQRIIILTLLYILVPLHTCSMLFQMRALSRVGWKCDLYLVWF